MYVYFIELENPSHTWIKIGKSNNPEKRLSNLQVASPYPLKLLAKIKYLNEQASFRAEALAHKTFGQERGCGEWFLLNGTKRKVRLLKFIENMETSTRETEKKLLLEQQQKTFDAVLKEVLKLV